MRVSGFTGGITLPRSGGNSVGLSHPGTPPTGFMGVGVSGLLAFRSPGTTSTAKNAPIAKDKQAGKQAPEFLRVHILFDHRWNSRPSLRNGSPMGMSAPRVMECRIHNRLEAIKKIPKDNSGQLNSAPFPRTG